MVLALYLNEGNGKIMFISWLLFCGLPFHFKIPGILGKIPEFMVNPPD
jgi:hypothetical protein